MESQVFTLKRWHTIALAFLVIGSVLWWGLNRYARQQILQELGHQEEIDCHDVQLNLWSGCVDFTQLGFSLAANDSLTLHFTGERVHLHGISYWQYLWANKLVVSRLEIDDFNIRTSQLTPKPVAEKAVQKPPKRNLSEIKIEELDLQRGKLHFQIQDLNLQADSISLRFEALSYSPLKEGYSLDWHSAAMAASKFVLDHSAQHHTLHLQSIVLTPQRELKLADIHWQPRHSKFDFAAQLPSRKARIDLRIPLLQLTDFSLKNLYFDQRFYARRIRIENAWLEAFSDRMKAKCKTCPKSYFYEKIADVDWPIQVDSLQILNSHIIYEERQEKEPTPGQLEWTQVYASIYDLTNETTGLSTIDIQAQFQGEAQVNLQFKVPTHDTSPSYHFVGTLDNLDLKQINHFLTFSKRLKIKNGQLRRLTFKGQGNQQEASGEMELRYRDLNIELLDNEGQARKIVSVLANSIISKKNNPDRHDQLRRGQMYSERVLHKSFLGNWWWCLQTGIKSTILPNLILPDELDSEKELVTTQ